MYEVDTDSREHESALYPNIEKVPKQRSDTRRPRAGHVFGLGAFLLLAAGLAFGASRSYS
jgi:hypothetical protein